MKSYRTLREGKKVFYNVTKILVKLILLFFFRIKVEGRDNEPQDGAVIVCSNHISWWDPPLIGCILKRRVFFMAKQELFQSPLFGCILKLLGAFPVKRGSPDRKAIKKSLQVLKQNKVLGLFPEGTRSKTGKLQKPEPGVGFIAIKSRAKILPIAIKGKYGLFKPIHVKIGKPMELKEYYKGKISHGKIEEASYLIMNEIKKLLS